MKFVCRVLCIIAEVICNRRLVVRFIVVKCFMLQIMEKIIYMCVFNDGYTGRVFNLQMYDIVRQVKIKSLKVSV